MKQGSNYIPALRWSVLTPAYDSVLRWIMRENYFKQELLRLAQPEPGQTVLDLGCGTATLTVMLKKAYPEANITGLDVDSEVLRIGKLKASRAGTDIYFDQGFAYDLPYKNKTFDIVLSSLMFHHLTRQRKLQAIMESYRVLCSGGIFYLLDFGKPIGVWSHIISPLMDMLEEVADNHKGLLPEMMKAAGFASISVSGQFNTIFGTVYISKGQKFVA